MLSNYICFFFFFFQAEDGIRDHAQSRGLGDVYKRQGINAEYMGTKFKQQNISDLMNFINEKGLQFHLQKILKTQNALKNLCQQQVKLKFKITGNLVCNICNKCIPTVDQIKNLTCSHLFHKQCIKQKALALSDILDIDLVKALQCEQCQKQIPMQVINACLTYSEKKQIESLGNLSLIHI
eukprot:TRINITY_DN7872_c0_g1_i3.p1 TRINITY_DN7872_c0_g1~~TRINITY_DN7872_c0_g1_i3.p1  ORF type:complete len:181 (-),score=34.27 TRINITY_DN7872_c0_g1_i3:150-692(-)